MLEGPARVALAPGEADDPPEALGEVPPAAGETPPPVGVAEERSTELLIACLLLESGGSDSFALCARACKWLSVPIRDYLASWKGVIG